LMAHQPILAVVTFLFIHIGGVGVREHSLFAATVVFVYYVIDTLASSKLLLASPGTIVLRVIITALLLESPRQLDRGALAIRLGRSRYASAPLRYVYG
jgi:hypothetical protein